MDNKQLLERAAKAAGYEIDIYTPIGLNPIFNLNKRYWNPIESDADAFRLMVDCSIDALIVHDGCVAVLTDGRASKEFNASHNNDKHAAARMAVTRAAAQSQEGAHSECD